MGMHAVNRTDTSASILDAAAYAAQGVLGVHFWETYSVQDAAAALDAADRVESALDRAHMVIVEGSELDSLRRLRTAVRGILKLRCSVRDDRWKAAWTEITGLVQ